MGVFLSREELTGISTGDRHSPKLDVGHLVLSKLGPIRGPTAEPLGLAPGPEFHYQPDRNELAVWKPGALVTLVSLPSSATQLDLDVRLDQKGSQKAHFRVLVVAFDGAERTLMTLSETSGGGGHSIPIDDLAGSQVILVFEFDLPVDDVRWVVSGMRVRTSSTGDEFTASASTSTPVPEGPKADVLLLILDALRADHVGAYGYERDTTPHIDRLASESVVFYQAHADCAATSCSVPALLTGVPQVLANGGGLVDAAWRIPKKTLAETLRHEGYRTVAFTANPNNRLDQGFDEFHRSWDRPFASAGDRSAIAQVLSSTEWIMSEASRLIRAADPAVPLYLQVHLLPPHGPYAPGEGHDVFGDPRYRGPVTQEMSLIPIGKKEMLLTPADLERLISLYDGNLRRGDAAVGAILDAWRDHRRWSSSIVVVTSDHGEAFFEHGHQGHNATVFDEMTRVPLILKTPSGLQLRRDRFDLVSLVDVAPTVRSLLGIESYRAPGSVDLFAPGIERVQRRLILRNNRRAGSYAVRSAQWKVILDPFRLRRPTLMFDLIARPDERIDSRPDRPLLTAGYTLELAAFLATRDSQGPGAGGLPPRRPAELETLRALGYVE